MTKLNKTIFVYTRTDVYNLIVQHLNTLNLINESDKIILDSFNSFDEMDYEVTGNADFCVRAETEPILEVINIKEKSEIQNIIYENL